jgi:protein TonB
MNYPVLKISVLSQVLSVAIHAAVIAGGGLLFMRQAQFGMSAGQGGAVGLASRRVLQAEVQIGRQSEKPVGRVSAVNPADEFSPVPDPAAFTAVLPPVGTGFNLSDLPVSAVARAAVPFSAGSPGVLTAKVKVKVFASGDGGARSLSKPVYLSNPPPAYPMVARQRGQEGRVLLRVTIGGDGAVRVARVKVSSGFAALDDAALNAVRKWVFMPASIGGVRVEDTIDLPIVFSLRR